MVLKIGMKMKYKKMPQFVFRKMRHFLVHRLTAKTNTVIYKVNRRELYCAVELPLSDYKLFGKQLVAR